MMMTLMPVLGFVPFVSAEAIFGSLDSSIFARSGMDQGNQYLADPFRLTPVKHTQDVLQRGKKNLEKEYGYQVKHLTSPQRGARIPCIYRKVILPLL